MSFGRLVHEADARLREWIDQNAPKPGTRLPSERALAARLGLQHYAINRAMSRLIAEGRVERDGYKLHSAAPLRDTPSFDSCHLVVAKRSVHLPAYKRVAKEMGIRLLVSSWESASEALQCLEQLDTSAADAAVFDPPYASPPSQWTPVAEKLVRRGLPVILINQPVDTLPSVAADGHNALEVAVSHLLERGHRQLGFVADAPATPHAADVIRSWENLCNRRGLPDCARRVHLQRNSLMKEEAGEVADMLTTRWGDITGLVLASSLDYNVQQLLEQLAQRGHHVPRDLSLVFIGGAKSPAMSIPPVSSITSDMALIMETAFNLARRAIRRKTLQGLFPAPACLRVQSQLHIRGSVRPLAAGAPADPSRRPAQPAPESPPPAETGRSLETCLRKPYPLAAKASLSERPRFQPLDLAGLVNRPLNFRRGWLGDLPLRHFAPGAHEIHGVPFNILGGPRRSDCGAIVFHSAVNSTGSAQPLPDRVSIPVGCKARAVYVLHGCGYAKFMHAFARYEFKHGKTVLGAVPIVSLGQPPRDHDPDALPPGDVRPNIQDWWPDFPHTDFPGARMAPILESDESGHPPRHVYLYTLEWINPRPEKSVDSLEIAVNPALSTTLGVLAATVVKP